ncbi:MAG TPA: hypothetical protein VMZ71_02015 [Gemmataceae bacterium]|nr:hypothetical protein [Gemmataceae bacterium]
MASAADAVAYAAQGGWDGATIMQVAYWLQNGEEPGGLTGQARQAIDAIGGMGLSSRGVSQLVSYLQTGQAPADLSYDDEAAQVLAPPPPAAPAAAPPAAGPAAPPTGPTAEQRSARAIVDTTLAEFGLQGLGDRVWSAVNSGEIVPEQISTYIRQTDEYKQRFAGMAQLQSRGRAISEAEYIATERSYAQVARAAGLPSGFYDSPDDFSRLIGGEVSPAEFSERVQTYSRIANDSPPEVRSELQRLYGIGPGELTAYFIDPDRALPLLKTQAQSASLSAAAGRTGFGGLQVSEAERLAQLGVTDQQAQEGFGALVDSKELFSSLDAGESAIGRDVQIGAAFEGNARARSEIEKRRARRKAQFDGGGSYATDKAGFAGIGSAT